MSESKGITEVSLAADDFKAGEFPIQHAPVTIASGQGELAKGTVLGKISASGKYAAYDDDASDGTQAAKLILAEAVDATSADVKAMAWRTGCFKESKLTGIDDNGIADLDALCIFVR